MSPFEQQLARFAKTLNATDEEAARLREVAESMRPTLADFLLARIEEDEDEARRAAFGYGAKWTSETDDAEDWSVVHADGKRDMVGCEDPDVTRHVASHDPARVLAECEAKRRIVERYQRIQGRTQDGDLDERLTLGWVLESLAVPYAMHPDYRQEWTR